MSVHLIVVEHECGKVVGGSDSCSKPVTCEWCERTV